MDAGDASRPRQRAALRGPRRKDQGTRRTFRPGCPRCCPTGGRIAFTGSPGLRRPARPVVTLAGLVGEHQAAANGEAGQSVQKNISAGRHAGAVPLQPTRESEAATVRFNPLGELLRLDLAAVVLRCPWATTQAPLRDVLLPELLKFSAGGPTSALDHELP